MLLFAVGILLVTVSALAMFAASIWHIVQAFQTSIVWGLLVFFGGCLFSIPNIVFIFKDVKENGKPFIIMFGVIPPYVLGVILLMLAQLIQQYSQ